MRERDIATGKGFTNGLSPADIEFIRKALVDAAVDAYRAGLNESIEQTAIALDEERERAIRQCVAILTYLHDYEAPHDAHKDALWIAIKAVRALLEKS